MPSLAATLTDPWDVNEVDFPWNGSVSEQLVFLLNYAVLAPSGHNTQPWKFAVVGDELEVYADRTRALAVIDPDDRQLVISCGAALAHLRLAACHFGFKPIAHILPDISNPDLMATLRLGGPCTATLAEQRMFMAIKRRRTYRKAFDARIIPQAILDALQEEAAREGVTLHVQSALEDRLALADLIAQGDRIQGSDKRFRRELAAWLHPNRTQSLDGIPAFAHNISTMRSLATPLVVRTFDWGAGRAAHDHQLAEGSPVLLVFTTANDTPIDWLRVGQALGRVLLLATDEGLFASFLNQPIQVAELRSQVAALLPAQAVPQLILRLGYGRIVRHTPRRPVAQVIKRSY